MFIKKWIKKSALTVTALCVSAATLTFAACSSVAEDSSVYVVGIEQTTEADTSTFTVIYSDGSTSTFTVKNGEDGEDGADGQDVSIEDIYRKYIEEIGEISYAEFLSRYLTFSSDSSYAVAECLLSSAKIYTEFIESTTTTSPRQTHTVSDIAVYTGSAVIWSIDDEEDGYTYLVTNYHVVYDSAANVQLNGGAKTARAVYCYLYGSESSPVSTNTTDENGYTVYNYGSYAVECEYVGGSVSTDIAVLRAETSALKAVNPDIRAITLAEDYYVGQTAVAIGNPNDGGLSVTQGIVSVDNEYISLSIDGTSRSYRSIRIDTALYGGNSGGGLFNAQGQLIGITNAGDSDDQNINYAVPLEIVKGSVENILYYYNLGGESSGGIYKVTLGVTVVSQNSRYVYDKDTGRGRVEEEVKVYGVTENSIAQSIGLQTGDVISALVVNGVTHEISRTFHIYDLLLTVRAGDSLKVVYERNGEQCDSSVYAVSSTDLQEA